LKKILVKNITKNYEKATLENGSDTLLNKAFVARKDKNIRHFYSKHENSR